MQELKTEQLPHITLFQSTYTKAEIGIERKIWSNNTSGCHRTIYRHVDDQQNSRGRLPAVGVGAIFRFAHVITAINHVAVKLEAGGWFFNPESNHTLMSVKIFAAGQIFNTRANGVLPSGESDSRKTASLPAPEANTQTFFAAAMAA